MDWGKTLKERCRDWCACYGEPPCWETGAESPCDDCINGRENPDWNAPAPVADQFDN